MQSPPAHRLSSPMMARDEMIEIPPGSFRIGSESFYPEEGPVREINIDAFAIDCGPVTVSQFAEFVQNTGYGTLAERPPDPADYPDADPSLLVAGSAVFHPAAHPSRSTIPANGGPTSRAPTGAIPGVPAATTPSARITRSPISPTRTPKRTQAGQARRCRPRRSGSTRRGAGSTARCSPGATKCTPTAS